jgi:uncharacterized membrane protein
MKRGVRKIIEGEARKWADEGIISGAQAEAIIERNRKEQSRPSSLGFNLLAALGGLCVALGIVLVISHNWERIHRFWKIGAFLLVLASTGEVLRILSGKAKIGRAALVILWIMLPLGGIGLWGQIYQMHGDSFKPLLAWLVLTAPLIWLTADRAGAFIHMAGIIVAVWVGAVSAGTWLSMEIVSRNWLMGRTSVPPDLDLSGALGTFGLPFFGVCLMWGWAFSEARKYLGTGSMRLAIIAMLGFIFWMGMGRTVFEVGGMAGAFLLGGVLTSIFWGLRAGLEMDDLESDILAILASSGVLYSMTFFWGLKSFFPNWGNTGLLAPYFLVGAGGVSIALLILADFRSLSPAGWPDRLLRVLSASPALLGFLMFFIPPKAISLLANLSLAGLGMWLINAGVVQNRTWRINAGVGLIGFLVFTRFIDYFGTMLQSGMAYIFTGIIFILLAWALNKGRQMLLARAQGGEA